MTEAVQTFRVPLWKPDLIMKAGLISREEPTSPPISGKPEMTFAGAGGATGSPPPCGEEVEVGV